MKNRILKFLSGFAAAALVVTTAIAQQPTQIQVHNINAGAVGGTWLLKPGTAPTGLHNIVFPNSGGTLVVSPTGTLTPSRLMVTNGSGNAATLDLGSGGLVYGVGNVPTVLTAGAPGTVLQMNSSGTAPEWVRASNLAWLLGGNTVADNNQTIGTNSNHDFNIETNGTTRWTIPAAGGLTQTGTGAITFQGQFTSNGNSLFGDDDADIVRLRGDVGINITNGGTTLIGHTGAGSGQVTISSSSALDLTAQSGASLSRIYAIPTHTIISSPLLLINHGASTNSTGIGTGTTTGAVTIGNRRNAITLGSPTITAPNLPAGAVGDNVVTSNAGALRTASITTILGGTPWVNGGNSFGAAGTLGTNDNYEVNIETNGTTRWTVPAAGGLTQTGTGAITLAGDIAATGSTNIGGLDKTHSISGSQISILGNATAAATISLSTGTNALSNLNVTSPSVGINNLNQAGQTVIGYNTGSTNNQVTIQAFQNNMIGDFNILTGRTRINFGGSAMTEIATNSATGNVLVGNSSNTVTIEGGTNTITGTTNINTVNTGLVTTIGYNVAGNALTINSPTITAPNIPAGAATDNLVTVDGSGNLRTTSVATMLGSSAWVNGGNSFGTTGTLGTNDTYELNIETGGTTRWTVPAAGGLTQTDAGAISLAGTVTSTGSTNLGDNAADVHTILGVTNINTSLAAATNIGTGTATGNVTIGNTANTTTLGSKVVVGAGTAQTVLNATLAAFDASYVKVTSTTATLGDYITMPAGTTGQIVYVEVINNGTQTLNIRNEDNVAVLGSANSGQTVLVTAIHNGTKWLLVSITGQP